ncbi:DNA-binding transcription factor [Lithospermum erythrorhizon]|uniref:DNA-binding transcription factor n=1 Tax=Lithospermum erythrorhizon TaxID=34254 RepID=A0AAV3NZR0_LITER
MTITESFVQRKLKIRIGSKGVSREYSDVITHADRDDNVSVHGNEKLKVNSILKLPYRDQYKKRGPVTILENQMEKRRKLDRGIKQQCANMLKDLKNHRYGWPFKEPVDPVALNIPDYFSIVRDPMDFGTIESKLEKNVYFSANEFAADVRLIFSNCMLYNPPHNQYHFMARELNSIFGSKLKLLEKKLKLESINVPFHCISSGNREVNQGSICMDRNTYPSKVSSVNRRAMPVEQKKKLVKDLKELLKGKMSVKLRSILQKYNLCSLKGSIDMAIDGIDDEVLWELKRTTNNLLKVTVGKIEAAKVTQSSACPLSDKDTEKRIDGVSRVSYPPDKVKPPDSSVNSKCGSCGSLTCLCSTSSNKVPSCKSKLKVSLRSLCIAVIVLILFGLMFYGISIFSSETAQHPGLKGVSRTDVYLETLATSCNGQLNPVTNGSGSVVEEAACVSPDSSVCGSMDLTNEGCTPAIDIHMSPKKALRAAMLKSRFADTIFKARHKTLLEQGDKADPVKLQWEKDKLEKQHREEKARIEAQIVAAEAASHLRAQSELKMQREREREAAQSELKMQREREREAARIALEQMERTIDIDDNLKFLRDLELMSRSSADSGCSLAGSPANPLERLGLYFKEDFIEDDDDDDVEVALVNSEDGCEEGEIMK